MSSKDIRVPLSAMARPFSGHLEEPHIFGVLFLLLLL